MFSQKLSKSNSMQTVIAEKDTFQSIMKISQSVNEHQK